VRKSNAWSGTLNFRSGGLGVASSNLAAPTRLYLKINILDLTLQLGAGWRRFVSPPCRHQTETPRALAIVIGVVAGTAAAQSCATQAKSKDAKPLAGTAKASFIKKCERES
jgi:hypothetical protein